MLFPATLSSIHTLVLHHYGLGIVQLVLQVLVSIRRVVQSHHLVPWFAILNKVHFRCLAAGHEPIGTLW
jgi:hypothetical protein